MIMRKKLNTDAQFVNALKKMQKAALTGKTTLLVKNNDTLDMPNINLRIEAILKIFNKTDSKNVNNMLFFIMYDIEKNKIRQQIAKYLIKKGCVRVQKSVFFASTDRKLFAEIAQTLHEVNQIYDNTDSIILIPVSKDEVQAMKLIGQNLDFNFVANPPGTLFF